MSNVSFNKDLLFDAYSGFDEPTLLRLLEDWINIHENFHNPQAFTQEEAAYAYNLVEEELIKRGYYE